MAFLTIPNVRIDGVAACVPKTVEENKDIGLKDAEKLISTTGIERRRKSSKEICTSDLCYQAANRLINDLGWLKPDIDIIIFVTQTPDYILPATSPIIQEKLGLSKDCFCLDISQGCAGYVYGLSTISALMQSGNLKKGLLLVGDTITKVCSPKDKSTYPIFGDAGTATALSFSESHEGFKFYFGNDGVGSKSIKINDGGFRNPFRVESLKHVTKEEGITRNQIHLELEGMDVFSFGIDRGPKSVKTLLDHFSITLETIDIFAFHQANLFMNEKIRKKLNLPPEKVPYSLKNFGNTSSASIPITLVTQSSSDLSSKELSLLACGFGVGLSWGAVVFKTNSICISPLIEI